MFIDIFYYTIVIAGALSLASAFIRLVDHLDHPTRRKEDPMRHTKPSAHPRKAETSSSAKRAA